MTNKERQKSLDKKKWLESEKNGEDMSSQMNYCKYCEFANGFYCKRFVSQEERESKCLCATAYNRMTRAKK